MTTLLNDILLHDPANKNVIQKVIKVETHRTDTKTVVILRTEILKDTVDHR